ncbi:MAG: T9SS type A sorting domain-containing protein [Paludibacter sp.]|nr:T9SS type A sorting domain-containing protein [Paludibacter sp.]
MKLKLFTLLFFGALASGYAYAQDASDFGANDILIANFENKNPVVTDSLWTDTLKTTPVTTQSANITLGDNPFPVENTSATAAKYVRKAGSWNSIFIRFNQSIILSKTPNLQIQVYPVSGKSPAKSSISINLINDKGEVVSVGGYHDNMPQDEWTTVTAFLGKNKSSVKYNAIMIQINGGDSVSKSMDTEYYIDQIGFKVPADGVEIPSTIFNETFNGNYNSTWVNEKGTASQFAAMGGFTSGIPFTFKDLTSDTVPTFVARSWGMSAKYEGASSGGRIMLTSKYNGTLETGTIDVAGNTNLDLSFGLGTQTWWPYNSDIANARPKVEISVDGGNFYEIYSNSTFLQFTGEQVDLGWGLMDKYEDQIFTLVDYPFTTIEGAPLSDVKTVNLRLAYKSGTEFWIDDLWLSGKSTQTGVSRPQTEVFKVYPNPATNYILTKNAQKVTIVDLNGRIVKVALNAEKVDVSSLAKGAYIVKVQIDNATKIGKLIKE